MDSVAVPLTIFVHSWQKDRILFSAFSALRHAGQHLPGLYCKELSHALQLVRVPPGSVGRLNYMAETESTSKVDLDYFWPGSDRLEGELQDSLNYSFLVLSPARQVDSFRNS